MFDPQLFWGEASLNAGANETQIITLEQRLGVKLPDRLILLLQRQNGGDSEEHGLFLYPTEHPSLPAINLLSQHADEDDLFLEDVVDEGFDPEKIIVIGGGWTGIQSLHSTMTRARSKEVRKLSGSIPNALISPPSVPLLQSTPTI